MHKDELIQLHTLLCQIKNHFEDKNPGSTAGRFEDYAEFGVSPQHIHKSKMQHKKAVFLLGKELAEVVMGHEPAQSHRIIDRFSRLAAKAGGEVIETRRSELSVLVN